MSGDLTVALIKNQSGQYDLELVRRLVVSNMRVGKITNLDRCVNLTTLNLSSNRIMDSATTGTSDGFSSAWPGPTLQREDGVRDPGTYPELAAAGEAGA